MRRGFVTRAFSALWRFASDRPYRGVLWLKLRRPPDAFQPSNYTREDRYPRVFAFVQSQLGRGCEGRILSFGCSTGEEVFSLRRHFPRAFIKGIDINPGAIAAARARLARSPDPGLCFETAGSAENEPAASYDAIFCMAVLRDEGGRRLTDGPHAIRFEGFAEVVKDLARCLKPGGLLAICYSNFRFCDAPASAGFEPVFRMRPSARPTPIFGPDDALMPGVSYLDTVFRKPR